MQRLGVRDQRLVKSDLFLGEKLKMKSAFAFGSIVAATVLTVATADAQTHRPVKHGGQICGNPKVSCKTSVTFQTNDLPFQVGKDMVIVDTVPFYAVILKSMA